MTISELTLKSSVEIDDPLSRPGRRATRQLDVVDRLRLCTQDGHSLTPEDDPKRPSRHPRLKGRGRARGHITSSASAKHGDRRFPM